MSDWRSRECALHEMIGCVTCSPERKAERRMKRSRGGGRGGEASVEFGVSTVELETPYSAEFVEDLKAAVPVEHRRWVPARKVWEISSEWWDEVAPLVEDYFTLVD